MTENQQARKKLQDELRKLFQFDVSDLDFGIYRILNRKKDQIEQFIEKDLLDAVKEGLKEYQQQDASQVDDIKQQIIENLSDDAFDEQGSLVKYENTRLGKDYLEAQEKAEKQEIGADTEKKIYNDLFTFFSRYYDNGDFLSKRRISTRNPKYAVPYNGEEVLLHWANKDQYYIKTGEQFTSFKFELEGSKKAVWFKVAQAETEKDNIKEEADRSFVLRPENPIEVDGDELTLWFEYRPLTDDETDQWLKVYNHIEKPRKTLDRQALCIAYDEWIRNHFSKTPPSKGAGEMAEWRKALSVIPKNKDRSLLYQKLNHYTGKNTTDYFIHKDLKSFLDRELEYYLKNEVIRVDDFIADQSRQAMEVALTRARVVRQIGQKIIAFLSQIENFQKKLFEKRKFVVDTHYCFTLDNVPEELYDTILENEDQLQNWEELYAMTKWEGDLEWDGKWTKEFLKEHPFIMVDTKYFDEEFKYRVLEQFDERDYSIANSLLCGENYQTLNLLCHKFINKIDSIYIDPPYNTGDDGFNYKDNYQSSSWLSMISQANHLGRTLLADNGALFASCDENEFINFGNLLKESFSNKNHIETITWNKRVPKNDKGVGNIHEYIYLFVKDYTKWKNADSSFVMKKDGIEDIYEFVEKLKRKKTNLENTKEKLKKYYKKQDFDRGITLYCELNPEYEIWGKINMSWPNPKTEGPRYEVINPVTKKPVPIPKNGWRWKEETFRAAEEDGPTYQLPDGSLMKGRIWYANDEKTQPSSIKYLREVESFLLRSILSLKSNGSLILENLGLGGLVDYPKPPKLVGNLLYSTQNDGALILDFFAGSGTTAEAVINLNDEDNGNRNYVMIDLDINNCSVIKKRIKKRCFSDEWKEGSPKNSNGQSHAFKYHFIESYEDALNNIDFKNPEDTQQAMQFEDYMLHYMLDFETQGASAALLREEAFETPFDYQLNIQRGHDSPKPEAVDMVETFHYLIGLWVQTLRRHEHQNRKYVVSKGQIRKEDATEEVCVIWRNTKELDLDKEAKWIQEKILKDQTFDRIYINGLNKVNNAEPIELTFREKMFEDIA